MSDKNAREAIEEKDALDDKTGASPETPLAGPHAKDHLTDKSKTPGAGTLTDEKDDEVNPGSG